MSKTMTTALLTALTLTGASMVITSDVSAKAPIPIMGRGGPIGGPIPSGHPGTWGHGAHGYYGRGFGGVVVIGASETCRVWTRFGFVRVPCDD
jgi:hypothetical protein